MGEGRWSTGRVKEVESGSVEGVWKWSGSELVK